MTSTNWTKADTNTPFQPEHRTLWSGNYVDPALIVSRRVRSIGSTQIPVRCYRYYNWALELGEPVWVGPPIRVIYDLD